MYGIMIGDWPSFNTAWKLMEKYMILSDGTLIWDLEP